ncbi:MAG: ComEA family DNA-binding protein [Actinomycetia bacterium]|nr:ComEA family DNA-binding protein [Actinomycetes bacterium]
MDNPRFERYLTCPPRTPSQLQLRTRRLCNELAHKIGLRQLKLRTALVAGVLFVLLAGFGLVRSGMFQTSASPVATGASAPVSAAVQPVETTVTVHVVVDQSAAAAASAGTAAVAPTGGFAQAAGGKINLNTADAQALDTLPGVGPATAQKIIADRAANGPFTSPEDLMRVSGIGQKKFDALKDLVAAP